MKHLPACLFSIIFILLIGINSARPSAGSRSSSCSSSNDQPDEEKCVDEEAGFPPPLRLIRHLSYGSHNFNSGQSVGVRISTGASPAQSYVYFRGVIENIFSDELLNTSLTIRPQFGSLLPPEAENRMDFSPADVAPELRFLDDFSELDEVNTSLHLSTRYRAYLGCLRGVVLFLYDFDYIPPHVGQTNDENKIALVQCSPSGAFKMLPFRMIKKRGSPLTELFQTLRSAREEH